MSPVFAIWVTKNLMTRRLNEYMSKIKYDSMKNINEWMGARNWEAGPQGEGLGQGPRGGRKNRQTPSALWECPSCDLRPRQVECPAVPLLSYSHYCRSSVERFWWAALQTAIKQHLWPKSSYFARLWAQLSFPFSLGPSHSEGIQQRWFNSSSWIPIASGIKFKRPRRCKSPYKMGNVHVHWGLTLAPALRLGQPRPLPPAFAAAHGSYTHA